MKYSGRTKNWIYMTACVAIALVLVSCASEAPSAEAPLPPPLETSGIGTEVPAAELPPPVPGETGLSADAASQPVEQVPPAETALPGMTQDESEPEVSSDAQVAVEPIEVQQNENTTDVATAEAEVSDQMELPTTSSEEPVVRTTAVETEQDAAAEEPEVEAPVRDEEGALEAEENLPELEVTFPAQQEQSEQEAISFSGGYTKVKLQQGREVITLSGGATVTVGSMTLKADTIEISGSDYRYVRTSGGVSVVDPERGIELSTSSLFYDRVDELIIVDGWVEIQDLEHEVVASGSWLEFAVQEGTLRLQMMVRLLKHTDKGAMICSAEDAFYDRDGETLALSGGASVYWNKDRYEASMITVDLKTDEIVMDGAIKGTVHG